MKRILGLLVFAATIARAADAPPQQFASLGDFRLDSGDVIRNCRVGYRIGGKLAADKSNVIVVLTWFAGRSADEFGWIGEGSLFDTTKYCVIVIDALGDGVSSSPSNSTEQPGPKFPRFTMRDMVRTQHEVLTGELKLDHVYAVAGLSMGGMQVFQWIASYPEFMDKAISIVGTPKQTSNDILLWRTELDLLETMHGSREAMPTVVAIQELNLHTPEWIAKNVTDVDKTLEAHRKSLADRDPFDYMSQLRAMIGHDIDPDFRPPLKPKMLVVVSLQDLMVNPRPAREFARVNKTALVTLTGDCGHLASGCERDVLVREVQRFLVW
ncbi:MAG TPA: alpha/beta fold hydrolase [Thermoanaerobaculia bacterium]|nr:alpha/beta fold hydrolase [Thermoanaerobaculia bacterium]